MTDSRKLIIHVGAQKCASTSLQQSLAALRTINESAYDYYMLDPWTLVKSTLTSVPTDPNSLLNYIDPFLHKQPSSETVIISHEVLFRLANKLQVIVQRAIESNRFKEIILVGYTRGHSDYFSSAFKQWHFRDKSILHDNISLFNRLNICHEKFTAMERYIFAKAWFCISNTTHALEMSWYDFYSKFSEVAKKFQFNLFSIYSNHIPSSNFPYSILRDFLQATGISVNTSEVEVCEKRSNLSFNAFIVQAISDILCDSCFDQSNIPTPHSDSTFLFRLSEIFSLQPPIDDLPKSSELLRYCSNVIDDTYYANNMLYCQLMNVNPSFFNPFNNVSMSEHDLLSIAATVESCRDLKTVSIRKRAYIDLYYSSVKSL